MAEAQEIAEAIAFSLAPLAEEFPQIASEVLGNPTMPCIWVSDGAVSYDKTFARGHDQWTFMIVALCLFGTDNSAQAKLRTIRASNGEASVKALVEAATDTAKAHTLGGVVINARVKSVSPIQIYKIEGSGGNRQAIGCEWTVEVLAAANT